MMRKYRGIVCEKQETHFVFLTTEGEFLRGTPVVENPSIGEEVEFYLLQPQMNPRKKWKPSFLAPILVAAVLLIVFVASMIPAESEKAYAYVQLEGVDSIELGVDEEGNVITLRSLDEASTEIGADWIGLPIAVVLTQAVQEISPKEEVVITTIYEKEEKEELKQTIEKAVTEVQQKNSEKPVQLEKSTKEERSKANEKQKSIQQYKKQKSSQEDKKQDATQQDKKQVTPPVDKAKQEKNPAAEKKQQQSPSQTKEKKKEKPAKQHEKKQEKNPHNNKEQDNEKNKKDHTPKGKQDGKHHNKP